MINEGSVTEYSGLGGFCISQEEYFASLPSCIHLSPTKEGKCLRCSNGIAPELCNKFKNCDSVDVDRCQHCYSGLIMDEKFNCIE